MSADRRRLHGYIGPGGEGPWSDNYWRDWWVFHGGLALALGLLGAALHPVIGVGAFIAAFVGGGINYLIDRSV